MKELTLRQIEVLRAVMNSSAICSIRVWTTPTMARWITASIKAWIIQVTVRWTTAGTRVWTIQVIRCPPQSRRQLRHSNITMGGITDETLFDFGAGSRRRRVR